MRNGKVSILQVINCARMGGGMAHLAGLFRHLDREKYHIALAADRGDYLVDAISEMGVPIHFIPMMKSRFDPRAVFRIASIAEQEGADILHCHGTRAAFFGALAKPLLAKRPMVYTVHGFSFHKDIPAPGRDFYRRVERFLGRRYDRLISVSENDRQIAIDDRLCPPEKISAIANAIEFSEFDPAKVNGRFRRQHRIDKEIALVGTAARLVPQKGVDVFLEAARIIAKSHPHARFVVVGEGKLEGRLRRLAEEKGLGDRVLFTGPDKKMADVYAGLDVFVLPSLWEGHPLTLIEALAMGVPTVATWTSGSPEIVEDGVSGLLVPPKDPRALAMAVSRMLDDRAYARALGAAGHSRVRERFSLARMARQTEAVFQDLIPGRDVV